MIQISFISVQTSLTASFSRADRELDDASTVANAGSLASDSGSESETLSDETACLECFQFEIELSRQTENATSRVGEAQAARSRTWCQLSAAKREYEEYRASVQREHGERMVRALENRQDHFLGQGHGRP